MAPLPIAYLPGGAGRSSFWRPVADRLWRRGAPIVLGYPGFGDAPGDATIGSLSELYDAIFAVLPARFHLVAQSMGNVLALRAALEHPERVASLVLCAVTGGLDVRPLGGADWRPSFRAERPGVPAWFLDDTSDFVERLPGLRAPTLIIAGDADPLSPASVGEFLRERIPFADLQIVSEGTHSMAQDDPDAIAVRIDRFIGARTNA